MRDDIGDAIVAGTGAAIDGATAHGATIGVTIAGRITRATIMPGRGISDIDAITVTTVIIGADISAA